MTMAFFSTAKLTYKDGLKSRILYGVLLLSLLLIVLSIFISGLFMRDIMKVLLDICLSTVSVGGLLIPFLIAVSHLSGDIERKSIYTILASPISRQQYILGKYLGLCALALTIMTILTGASLISIYVASFIYTKTFFPNIPIVQILVTAGLSYAAVSILISCTMLWCSLTTSSFLATLLVLSTYLVGQTVEDIVRFFNSNIPGVYISPVFNYATKAILYTFPNLGAFDFKQYAAHDLAIPFGEVALLLLYAGFYISLMLFLATIVFKRRDLA